MISYKFAYKTIKLDFIEKKDFLNYLFEKSLSLDRPRVLLNHNFHSLYVLFKRKNVKKFFEGADLTFIDSAPICILARIFWNRKVTTRFKVTSLDYFDEFLSRASDSNSKVFYLGGTHKVSAEGAAIINKKFPKLNILFHHGYLDSVNTSEVINKINNFQPDFLFVGMGTPLQEEFIFNYRDQLKTKNVLSIGAYLDYIAGAQPTPPRWLSNKGIEWTFRLLSNPQRLAFRYVVEPWFVVFRLVWAFIKTKSPTSP